jgi:hypothetical protein
MGMSFSFKRSFLPNMTNCSSMVLLQCYPVDSQDDQCGTAALQACKLKYRSSQYEGNQHCPSLLIIFLISPASAVICHIIPFRLYQALIERSYSRVLQLQRLQGAGINAGPQEIDSRVCQATAHEATCCIAMGGSCRYIQRIQDATS